MAYHGGLSLNVSPYFVGVLDLAHISGNSHFMKLFSVNLWCVPFVSRLNHEEGGKATLFPISCLYVLFSLHRMSSTLCCLAHCYFSFKSQFKHHIYEKLCHMIADLSLSTLLTWSSCNSTELSAYCRCDCINFPNVLIRFVGMSSSQFKAPWGLNIFVHVSNILPGK